MKVRECLASDCLDVARKQDGFGVGLAHGFHDASTAMSYLLPILLRNVSLNGVFGVGQEDPGDIKIFHLETEDVFAGIVKDDDSETYSVFFPLF